jgi:hypothetical protein
VLRFALTLLISVAGTAQGQADEGAERLLTEFREICYARPESITAIGSLAKARGFLGNFGGGSPSKPEDAFNWMAAWWLGEGKAKIELVVITTGNADKYRSGCWIGAADILPADVMAGVKVMPGIVGEPASHKVKDSKNVVFEWIITADLHQGVLSLYCDPEEGRQYIGLNFDQFFRGAAPK